MNRRGISVTSVLVVALLIATAQPASAAIIRIDSFEDGDVSEYTIIGDASNVTVQSNKVRSGSQALNLTAGAASSGLKETAVYSTSGLSEYPAQGDQWTTFYRFNGTAQTTLIAWAVQSETSDPDGYFVETVQAGNIELFVRDGGSTTTLATISDGGEYLNEWTNTTVQWDQSGQINISIRNESGLVGWLNASDTTFSSGGLGFKTTNNDPGFPAVATFDSPTYSISIRNESSGELITDQVTVTKYGNDSVETETTTSGSFNLTNFLNESNIPVKLESGNYNTRNTIIKDPRSEQNVYLINSTTTTSDIEFLVDDKTGLFPPRETLLIIERPVKLDGTLQYREVARGELTAANLYSVRLENDARYRIRVKNGPDERAIGPYVPEGDETVTLTIGDVILDPGPDNSPEHSANRTNITGSPVQVTFQYNDTTETTSEIYLHIYEYNNASNELLANTSFSGPFGGFSHTENVPSAENNTTWVVDFTAVRSGENINGQYIVGPQRPILNEMPTWLVTFMSIGLILMVAALFSQVNASIGAVVVAGVGGLLFYIDFVPPELGAGVMLLSLMAAGMIWINEHRGGNL